MPAAPGCAAGAGSLLASAASGGIMGLCALRSGALGGIWLVCLTIDLMSPSSTPPLKGLAVRLLLALWWWRLLWSGRRLPQCNLRRLHRHSVPRQRQHRHSLRPPAAGQNLCRRVRLRDGQRQPQLPRDLRPHRAQRQLPGCRPQRISLRQQQYGSVYLGRRLLRRHLLGTGVHAPERRLLLRGERPRDSSCCLRRHHHPGRFLLL